MTAPAAPLAVARAAAAADPAAARGVDVAATAVFEQGVSFMSSHKSGFVLRTDMSEALGGSGSAPSPGWVMRAVHAACNGTMIVLRAAELGIRLTKLSVTADSESDDRGMTGADDGVSAGPIWSRIRVVIAVDGASDSELRDLVAWARDHSPVEDAIRRAVPIDVEVEIAGSGS